MDDFYQLSFLFLVYRKYTFKMGYMALSNLLHDLGSCGEPVRMFEQKLNDNCSKNVSIDGHVLRSCSLENDLDELGFFSDTVLKRMSKDGNCYIIPLAVSNRNVKRIKET